MGKVKREWERLRETSELTKKMDPEEFQEHLEEAFNGPGKIPEGRKRRPKSKE